MFAGELFVTQANGLAVTFCVSVSAAVHPGGVYVNVSVLSPTLVLWSVV